MEEREICLHNKYKSQVKRKMKLIREEIESVEFIVEERNGKKSLYIEGVFLQGDIKNRNGRMYPMKLFVVKLLDTMRIMFKQEELLENSDIQMALL